MSHLPAAPTTRSSHLSRRAVTTAIAWTVPAVAVAVTAPAASASDASPHQPTPTTDAALRWNTWRNNWVYDHAGRITGIRTGIQVENRYNADESYQRVSKPVASVTVYVTYPASVCAEGSPTSVTGAGWSFGRRTGNRDGTVTYSFLYSAAPIAASNNTGELNVVIAAKHVRGASASAIAVAPNAVSVQAPSYGDPIY